MHRHEGSFAFSLHYAPLTLTTLAALVPPELDADITIYDETVERIPTDIAADIIGVTAITGTSQRAYRWADYYRARGATVVVGGVHPTLMPDEAAGHADAVVVGYAEDSWPRLLRDFAHGRMERFYRMAPDFQLGGYPTARRDLLRRRRYITTNTVEATRGCIHSCNFCVVPSAWGRGVITRPVREVVREVESLPGKTVVFVDVNLIAHQAYATELFIEMAPLKKWWFGLVTAVIGSNDELLALMAKSGCKGVLIGFEAVSEQSLTAVNKSFNQLSSYDSLVRKLHDHGIGVNGTFVLGTDGDDQSVFEQTYEAVQRLKIDLPRYSVMTPFPGTELYRSLAAEGRIIEDDWSMYDVEHCVFKPAQMSPEQLEEGLEWTWKATYRVPSIVRRIASASPLFALDVPLNLGYRKYAQKLGSYSREVMTDHSDVPNHEADIRLPGHRQEAG
jgi:radical SAM superfamily enzyme YgiQ (UPF0313 family)